MVDATVQIGVKADIAGIRRIKRSLDDVAAAGIKVGKSTDQVNKKMKETSRSAGGLKRAMQGLVAVFGARELVQTVDTYTNIQNRLKLVTTGTEQLASVTQELFAISNETRQSFEGTAEVYSRVALATKEMGISADQTLAFTKSLNQAVALSGASAMEAQAGLIQLSQGLASGALRGDELRSVLEQLPAVADVIAKGLGVTRGELREMGQEGKITAGIVIDAFAKAQEELEQNFGKTVPTIGQSFTVLKNNLVGFIGELDKATNASANLSKVILLISNNIDIVVGVLTAFTVGLLAVKAAGLGVAAAIAAIKLALIGPLGLAIAFTATLATALYFNDEIRLAFKTTGMVIQEAFDDAMTAARIGMIQTRAFLLQITEETAREAIKAEIRFRALRKQRRETELAKTISRDIKQIEPATAPTKSASDIAKEQAASAALKEAQKKAQKELGKLFKKTRTEAEALNDEIARLNELKTFATTAEEIDAINRGLEIANEKLKTASTTLPGMDKEVDKLKDTMDDLADSIGDAFAGFLSGTTSAKDAFRSLVNDMLSAMSKRFISDPLSNILGTAVNSIAGGFFGGSSAGLFSPATASSPSASSINWSGPRAPGFNSGGSMVLGGVDNNTLSLNGAPIANVSRGEVLSVSPKDKSGGGGTVINQTINVSTGVKETVAAEIQQFMPKIQEATRSAIKESELRGF
jgi:tape measure domain-containing protein